MKTPSSTLAVCNVIAPPPRPTFFAATLVATALSCPVALIALVSHLLG